MNKFLFYVILLLFLQFVGCNSDRTSLDNTHLGGCILIDSVAEIPSDIYQMTSIIETNEYEPFNKKLTVCGIILIGRDEISNGFMQFYLWWRYFRIFYNEYFPRITIKHSRNTA